MPLHTRAMNSSTSNRPVCTVALVVQNRNLGVVTLGFACHSENSDYKVLRVSCCPWIRPNVPDDIAVYSLSSDSWRRVGMSLRANVKAFDNSFLLPTPLVSGALHWISRVLEEFRMLRMPDGAMSIVRFQTCLALFKGNLAFLTFGQSEQRGGYQYSIWVMRECGVLESWNKLFVVPLERLAVCIAFTMCGSLLTLCLRTNNQEQKFV
ncbi:F-box protein CPR1-like [Quercus suber]|uniref:F-box protein CPR1-like n=1 Tax=Quercus suber TaxID=58331 RepID=UPI0032DF67B3